MSTQAIKADIKQQFRAAIKNDPVLSQLIGMTPAEVEQFVNSQVTDLASAKTALAKNYKLTMMLLLFLQHQFND